MNTQEELKKCFHELIATGEQDVNHSLEQLIQLIIENINYQTILVK